MNPFQFVWSSSLLRVVQRESEPSSGVWNSQAGSRQHNATLFVNRISLKHTYLENGHAPPWNKMDRVDLVQGVVKHRRERRGRDAQWVGKIMRKMKAVRGARSGCHASGIILSISNSQTVPRDWAVRSEFVLDQLFSRGVLEWARWQRQSATLGKTHRSGLHATSSKKNFLRPSLGKDGGLRKLQLGPAATLDKRQLGCPAHHKQHMGSPLAFI